MEVALVSVVSSEIPLDISPTRTETPVGSIEVSVHEKKLRESYYFVLKAAYMRSINEPSCYILLDWAKE